MRIEACFVFVYPGKVWRPVISRQSERFHTDVGIPAVHPGGVVKVVAAVRTRLD